jgi:DNA-binding CsgD family transcriptional regulator
MGTTTPSPLDLLGFADELTAASNLDELERRYHDGVDRFIEAPMRSIYLLDPRTRAPERCATVGVSELFLERYEMFGRQDDPLHAHVMQHGEAGSNFELVGWEEWSKSDAYLRCSRLHRMVGLVEAPIVIDGTLVGNIHLARHDDAEAPDQAYVRTGAMLAAIVGIAVKAVRSRAALERRCEEALAALDLVSTPLVLTDPERDEPYANAAAQDILDQLPEPGEAIYSVITAPPGERDKFERELPLALRDGAVGVLHGRSRRVDRGRLVTVLHLDAGQARLHGEEWSELTPREREVAALVADDHSDAAIAAILVLSTHTVSQYVKRIYRKLGVSSRVGLTRLVLQNERRADHPQD